PTTKEAGRGTGLGLAMVKGFVEQSGGDLAIRSLPLAGTAITLTLPAAPIAATPAEADEGDAEVGDLRGRFLVVEDEDEVRALVVDVLRQHRAEVTASSSAGAALAAAAATGPFDVLITDLVMPGMRGDELASRLTSQGRVRQVVFMSGYHDARPEPPDGAVLAKPFAVRDLVRAARAALAATGRPDVAKELIPA
ncbi:response regulator, partial [bacterium]|nr:response regulator [bacterium]